MMQTSLLRTAAAPSGPAEMVDRRGPRNRLEQALGLLAPPVELVPSAEETPPVGRLRRAGAWMTRHPLTLLGMGLIVWGLTDVRSRGATNPDRPGVHRTDFTVYTEAGAAFFDGRDPYSVTNPRGWGYLYPPLFAMLLAPLHALPGQTQVVAWFFLSVLFAWGCYRECLKLWRLTVGSHVQALPWWCTAAACTAVAFPALNCLQRGQVGILKTWLLLVGMRWLLESRSWRRACAAGAILAAAIVLKVTPALPVGLLLSEAWLVALGERKWRNVPRAEWLASRHLAWSRACGLSVGTLAGLILGLVLIPTALVGADRNTESLARWWNLVAVRAQDAGYDLFAGNSYSVQNQSLLNAARHLGNWAAHCAGNDFDDLQRVEPGQPAHVMDSDLAARWLLAARMVLVALAGSLVWLAARRREPLTTAAVFGLAAVASLIVAPIARAHYFVLVLPAVLFVALWCLSAGQARLARWLAWFPGLLTVAHYLAPGIAGRLGLLGLGTTAWFVTAVAALWILDRRQLGEHRQVLSFRVGQQSPIAGAQHAALPAHAMAQLVDRESLAQPPRTLGVAEVHAAGN